MPTHHAHAYHAHASMAMPTYHARACCGRPLQVALGKPLLLQASAESPSRAPLRMRVSRPPEPSDVLWENLPCSRLECGLRQALGRARA